MASRRIAVVMVALLVVSLSGCAGVAASPGPQTPLASMPPATGDRRTVAEPTPPSTVCATIPATSASTSASTTAPTTGDETDPPDTARIQAALDSCAQAGSDQVAVSLTANGADTEFLSGPLTIRQGEVLLLGSNVTLLASRNPANYQLEGASTCGTVGGNGKGCAPFITLAGAHSGVESTPAADGSQGRIDGRGGQPMLGTDESWWQLSASAKAGGAQNVPRLIQSTGVDDVTLHDVDLVNSPGFHVSFQNGDGFTAWGVRIQTPATARNTDGIDPAGATDVTIADSWIMDGDDGIAIKGGSVPSAHITITHDHFFGTHGISIGSETTSGVSDVLVADDTVDGTDAAGNASIASAGIRIKSSREAGGAVTQVTYRDICVTRTKAPIDIDPDYEKGSGDTTPSFTGIVIDGLAATASSAKAVTTLHGLNAQHPLQMSLTNVAVDAPTVSAAHADLVASNATFGGTALAGGDEVTITAAAGAGAVPQCSFPAYPAL